MIVTISFHCCYLAFLLSTKPAQGQYNDITLLLRNIILCAKLCTTIHYILQLLRVYTE